MQKIIIISGPTGVGKTNISIKLAKAINGEIISADSIQVYKGFDIGSAKITSEEMQNVPHHLIDCMEPDEGFSVDVFQAKASKCIDDITSRGKIPIIVGGTAFYIQALLKGVDFTQENHDYSYREELEAFSEDELYERLSYIDPEYASSVHKNNKKRVIRALEYNHFTGELFSKYNESQSLRPYIYDFKYFVLEDERELLYSKCDMRVDEMIKAGLIDEVKHLKDIGISSECQAMQAIGYKEILDYLDSKCTLDEAIEAIKVNTRHYVKRQLTWFCREKDIIRINKNDFNHDDMKILDFILNNLKD